MAADGPTLRPNCEKVTAPLQKLRVLDLFSGIGGFSLGLERTGGFETVAFCEIDPFCRRVLAKHWPAVPCFEDVTKLRGEDVGSVDVISGGFPCQDVSRAGNRAGITGARSGLWAEMRRLVGELGPRIVLVENTPGLLDDGLGVVLADLAAFGYDVLWNSIPASAVGAPHDRDRVWLVAYARGERRGRSPKRDAHDPSQQLQNLDRLLALLLSQYQHKPDADPFNAFGARIPDGGADRAEYVRTALRRKDDGFSAQLDRLRALGNAVVPQVVELLGHAILEARRAT